MQAYLTYDPNDMACSLCRLGEAGCSIMKSLYNVLVSEHRKKSFFLLITNSIIGVFLRWNRSTKCLDEAYEEMVHIIEYNKELQNKVNSLRRQLAQLETEDGPLQNP